MQKYLCSLSDADFTEIKNLAALFFTPREIAVMLELPADLFVQECATIDTKCYLAFHAGRLQQEVDLRTSIIKLAKSGSSPAQTMAMDLLKQSKIKIIDR